MLAGEVTALTVCNSQLCIAMTTPDLLMCTSTADLTPNRLATRAINVHTLVEPVNSARQWVAGWFGSQQALRVCSLSPVQLPGSLFLAVMYTNGTLSLWDPTIRRHVGQASATVSSAVTQTESQPGMAVVSAMYVSCPELFRAVTLFLFFGYFDPEKIF